MAESFIQLPPNSTGLKAHTFDRTIGANLVQDEVVLLGEQYLPTYVVVAAAQAASAGSNPPLVLMAGASLKLRIRRIRIEPRAATAAGLGEITIRRCTSAPTGGVAVTPAPFDPAAAAAGATAQTAPTGGATGSDVLLRSAIGYASAAPQPSAPWEWIQSAVEQPIIIAAGTTNGLRFEITGGPTAAGVSIMVEFSESSF